MNVVEGRLRGAGPGVLLLGEEPRTTRTGKSGLVPGSSGTQPGHIGLELVVTID